MFYSNIRKQNLQGVDVNPEITLKEYGFAWHELVRKQIYRIYIGCTDSVTENEFGETEFKWWEALELPFDTDIREEYSWCNFEAVADFCGASEEEWHNQSLPSKLFDLISYYSSENF
jgi:hypothetical protein